MFVYKAITFCGAKNMYVNIQNCLVFELRECRDCMYKQNGIISLVYSNHSNLQDTSTD